MIVSKLQKIINDQIMAELWSANLYLQMSYFLKHQGWDGYAHWMRLQAEEEREHATRMADYMSDRGGIVKLQMIDVVPEGWGSVLEVFEHVYKHECMVSKMIDKIVLHAIEEQDFATENFFRIFVDEQVEEEESARDMIAATEAVEGNKYGMYMLDKELAARAYNTPSPLATAE